MCDPIQIRHFLSIDVSVNGLGERCGNAALSEVVVGLSALYGFDTGIDLSLMKELSEYVEKISGVYIPENKPLVGKFAFSDTLDLVLNINSYGIISSIV